MKEYEQGFYSFFFEGQKQYFSECVLPSGQYIYMQFSQEVTNKTRVFWVFLETKDKRKNDYPCLQITGKDGLSGLLWARQQLIDFEAFILGEYPECRRAMYICFNWEDGRRRDVYYRGVKELGYMFDTMYNTKILAKRIRSKQNGKDRRNINRNGRNGQDVNQPIGNDHG